MKELLRNEDTDFNCFGITNPFSQFCFLINLNFTVQSGLSYNVNHKKIAMPLKEWLFTNMTIRNMLADFGYRRETGTSKVFSEYFRYEIGKYKTGDYLLYFPEPPFWDQYRNEGFNKLKELNVADVPKYLLYHFEAYPDKADFVRFLKYEANLRLERTKKHMMKVKLGAVLGWLAEQERELQQVVPASDQTAMMQEIQSLVANEKKSTEPDIRERLDEIKRLIAQKDEVNGQDHESLQEVFDALPSGNIELNNQLHEDKLIEFLYLVSAITFKDAKGLTSGPLFKKFNKADISSILKNHFASSKKKKFNTIQKRVGEVVQNINWKDPYLKKVNEALEQYFDR